VFSSARALVTSTRSLVPAHALAGGEYAFEREPERRAFACACTNGPGNTKRGAHAKGNNSGRCRGTRRPAIPPHRDSQWSAMRTRACGASGLVRLRETCFSWQPGHRSAASGGRKNGGRKNLQQKSTLEMRRHAGSARGATCARPSSTSSSQTHAISGQTSVLEEIDRGNRSTPLVLKGRIEAWPARAWTPSSLAQGPLGGVRTVFRFARKSSTGIVREGDCHYQAQIPQKVPS